MIYKTKQSWVVEWIYLNNKLCAHLLYLLIPKFGGEDTDEPSEGIFFGVQDQRKEKYLARC